jgi:hypothetical protein
MATEPLCKIEWHRFNSRLNTLKIIRDTHGIIGEDMYITSGIDFFNIYGSIYIQDTEYVQQINELSLIMSQLLPIGKSVMLSEISQYVRPCYIQLCKYLGIRRIGCIVPDENVLWKTLTPIVYKGNTIEPHLTPHNLRLSQHITVYDHQIHNPKNNTTIRIPKEEVPIVSKLIMDNLYSPENIARYSSKINYIPTQYLERTRFVFCHEEHGIYGNLIDPQTLYPLKLGFIMSNVMNSIPVEGQQEIISGLEHDNAILKSKVDTLEQAIITTTGQPDIIANLEEDNTILKNKIEHLEQAVLSTTSILHEMTQYISRKKGGNRGLYRITRKLHKKL